MNQKKLPKIAVLGTGGTIAGTSSSATQYAGYAVAATGVDKLLAAVPTLQNIASVECEQVAQVASQNLGATTLLHLAARVNHWLSRSDCDGVVVTVGTNTLEETAYFLNLVAKGGKAVVVTGAMRPSTSLSADGPMNLYRAVVTASDPISANLGVLVVMNDLIIAARDVVKTDTMAIDTFKSPVFGILGWVIDSKVHLYKRPARLHTDKTEFEISKVTQLPRIDIVVGYQDDSGVALSAFSNAGAKGLIIAGAGTASLSDSMTKAVTEVIKAGVVVVRTPRSATGIVARNIEFDDDKYGTVAGDTLSPAKAKVLLALALAHGMRADEIQAAFDKY